MQVIKFFLFSVFVLGLGTVRAQSPDVTAYYTKVSPPSPEASTFVQYGTIQAKGSTGAPTIEIPLYEIITPSFKIPITLNYESTGYRPDEIASWVGAGWLLNTGGVITRTVMGKPDEGNGGFLNQTHYSLSQLSVNSQANADYMKSVADNLNETEPDIYYYSFNGHSGQFTYDQNNNIYQMPQTPLKISRIGQAFQIIDENGNRYTFGAGEYSSAETDASYSAQDNCVTSWWLTKMQNAEKTEEINFNYQTDKNEFESKTNYGAHYGPTCTVTSMNNAQFYQPSGSSVLSFNKGVTNREWAPVRLISITYKNGQLLFNRIDDRLDGGSSRLDNIEIYSYRSGGYQKNKTLKFITNHTQYTGYIEPGSFFYSSSNGKYRLKLNCLEAYDATNSLIQKHSFEYEDGITYRGSLAQDFWGFYNGADANNALHTLLPKQTTPDLQYEFGGANRESDESSMKMGILKRIIYPTGGYSTFDWEAHKYLYSTTTETSIIQSITAYGNNQYNNPQPTQTTNFTYSGSGTAVLRVNASTFDKSTMPPYSNPAYQTKSEDYPAVYLKDLTNNSTVYSTHILNGSVSYVYNANISLIAGHDYQLIAECYINSTSASVSISVSYSGANSTPSVKTAGGLRISVIQNFTNNGVVATKDIYKYGGNDDGVGSLSSPPLGLYNFTSNRNSEWDSATLGCSNCQGPYLLSGINYSASSIYGLNPSNGSVVNYSLVTKYHVTQSGVDNGKIMSYYSPGSDFIIYQMPANAEAPFYFVTEKWSKQDLDKEEVYKRNGSGYVLVKRSTNKYVRHNAPDNIFIKTGFNRDMSHAAQFTYNKFYLTTFKIMSGTLKLESITTEEIEDNQSIVKDRKTTYDDTYHDLPASVTSTDSKGKILKNIYKYAFNKSQISGLSTIASSAIDRLILNNIVAVPLEQEYYVDNALMNTVRVNYQIYSSVSPDMVKPHIVQSKFKSKPFEDRYLFTDYHQNGQVKSRNIASAANCVYLWGYNGTQIIAEIKNAVYQDVLSVLGQATIDQLAGPNPGTDNAIRSSLNALRTASNLSAAQITTYTYDALVGMTSQTDSRGNVTYYEYDGFQRLKNIKNQNGDITRSFCYNYAGEQTGCPLFTDSGTNPGGTTPGGGTGPGTPPASTQIYVRMEDGPGSLGADGHYYGTFVFRSYSDANFSTPYNVPSTYGVSYRVTSTTTTSGSSNTTTSAVYSTSIPAGGNSKTITVDVNTCGQVQSSVAAKSGNSENGSAKTSAAASGGGSTNAVPGGGSSCTTATVEMIGEVQAS